MRPSFAPVIVHHVHYFSTSYPADKSCCGHCCRGISLGIYSRMMTDSAHADSGSPSKVFGSGPAFVSLPLESSEVVNHNTKRLRFRLPDENAVSGLALTSAVLTISWPKGRWLPVARPYTPISPSDQPGTLDLLVKLYPDGKQSTHLHSLSPGETLLFAAAGITPIYQLTQGILRNPEDKTNITLVFGINTDADALLKPEFDAFEKDFPGRFEAIYTHRRFWHYRSKIDNYRSVLETFPLNQGVFLDQV
ncbi:NADH-cytochrome b5 reductase [Verticillium dahliae]|nr:NADH-cytochrome b5 reductase [Verticillium dahliae]